MSAMLAWPEKKAIDDWLDVDLLLACFKQVVIEDWCDQSAAHSVAVGLLPMVGEDRKEGLTDNVMHRCVNACHHRVLVGQPRRIQDHIAQFTGYQVFRQIA